MVSLFLVEDERIPRESIKNNVPWRDHGIEFLGAAPDGEVALPQILESKPDILLTDIKMPFMDGLELSKIIRDKLPQTVIIILSGYNEFDYARQAISLGISEYLLKPASAEDILCAVNKVRSQIEHLRVEAQATDRDHAAQREVFFSGLYSGFLSGTRQIIERAEHLALPVSAAIYQVVTARLSPSQTYHDDRLREALYHTQHAQASGYNGVQVVYLLQAESDAALEVKRQALFRDIEKNGAGSSFQMQWHTGEAVRRLSDIAASYQTACLKAKRIDLDSKTGGLSGVTPFQDDALLAFLRMGKESTVQAFWAQYRHAVESAFASFIYRCYLYTELFLVISQFAKEIGMDIPTELTESDILEKRIVADTSVDDFIGFGCELCRQAMVKRDQKNHGKYSPAVERAREYVKQHYADSALSLTQVAEAVHLSPNHLSTSFKEKTGVGLSEYLIDIRIRHAKQLLATTDLLASEVGERVGYQNMNYFSMLFKRIVGMSPSQYRREHMV